MVYPIAKLIFAPIIDIWIKEINGLNNIPVQGPFIITANHESYMDHLIIVKTFVMHLNKKIHFLSKKEHFSNPIKSIWHRWAGAIPLDRESKGTEALKWAIKALKSRNIIGIHPEGTRSLTGKLQKAKPKYILENAYEAMREAADSVLYVDGFKSFSHEASIIYLAKKGFKV